MPLENLLALVEKLRERIDAHGPALRQSEALTRYTLIDPLLRELGWDTEDPTLVIPEYKEAGGSADYALFSGNKPLIIVEAKKLDTSLRDEKVLIQGLAYCQKQGTYYLSVTDGRRWEIYEPHRGGAVPIDKKRIVEFDLKNGSAAEVCSKALALRRSNVERLPDSPRPPEAPTPTPQPPSPGQDEHEWQPISGLNPQKGHASPREVRFPDGLVRPLTTWRELMDEVTRWLVDSNYLTTSNCPIQKPRSKFYVVSSTPVHPDGREFGNPHRIGGVESLYTEGFSGPQVADIARTVIESVNQDSAQFKVRFSPP